MPLNPTLAIDGIFIPLTAEESETIRGLLDREGYDFSGKSIKDYLLSKIDKKEKVVGGREADRVIDRIVDKIAADPQAAMATAQGVLDAVSGLAGRIAKRARH